MNDETDDDIPTALTRLLRNVDGVYTVYATQGLVPTLVTAVVEAVRSDMVGMHLVTVHEGRSGREVTACIGVTSDESAIVVCRRAHEALRDYFIAAGLSSSSTINVRVGRVG